jgi:hypothetical protein
MARKFRCLKGLGQDFQMLMATMPHVMHVSNEDKIGSAGPDHAARSTVKPGGSIMSMRVRLFAILIATCALPSWSSAQVITHRDVGVRMGLAIAVAALDQCEADGNSVSVAVVDRAGRLRVFLQGTTPTRTISNWPGARPIRRGPSAAPAPSGPSEPPICPNWRRSGNSPTSSLCAAACRSRSATRRSARSA